MNEYYIGPYLCHYGTKRHSGRYPFGSGKNPYQDYPQLRKTHKYAKQEWNQRNRSGAKIAKAAFVSGVGTIGVSGIVGGVSGIPGGILAAPITSIASVAINSVRFNNEAKKYADYKVEEKYQELKSQENKIKDNHKDSAKTHEILSDPPDEFYESELAKYAEKDWPEAVSKYGWDNTPEAKKQFKEAYMYDDLGQAHFDEIEETWRKKNGGK